MNPIPALAYDALDLPDALLPAIVRCDSGMANRPAMLSGVPSPIRESWAICWRSWGERLDSSRIRAWAFCWNARSPTASTSSISSTSGSMAVPMANASRIIIPAE